MIPCVSISHTDLAQIIMNSSCAESWTSSNGCDINGGARIDVRGWPDSRGMLESFIGRRRARRDERSVESLGPTNIGVTVWTACSVQSWSMRAACHAKDWAIRVHCRKFEWHTIARSLLIYRWRKSLDRRRRRFELEDGDLRVPWFCRSSLPRRSRLLLQCRKGLGVPMLYAGRGRRWGHRRCDFSTTSWRADCIRRARNLDLLRMFEADTVV